MVEQLRMTPVMKKLYELAVKNKLDCPLGRAIYITSRRHNESVGANLEEMQRCRLSTAERWLEHWNNGGSIKSLKYSEKEFRLRSQRSRHMDQIRMGKCPRVLSGRGWRFLQRHYSIRERLTRNPSEGLRNVLLNQLLEDKMVAKRDGVPMKTLRDSLASLVRQLRSARSLNV